jgi:hypothetical protein
VLNRHEFVVIGRLSATLPQGEFVDRKPAASGLELDSRLSPQGLWPISVFNHLNQPPFWLIFTRQFPKPIDVD